MVLEKIPITFKNTICVSTNFTMLSLLETIRSFSDQFHFFCCPYGRFESMEQRNMPRYVTNSQYYTADVTAIYIYVPKHTQAHGIKCNQRYTSYIINVSPQNVTNWEVMWTMKSILHSACAANCSEVRLTCTAIIIGPYCDMRGAQSSCVGSHWLGNKCWSRDPHTAETAKHIA
jgi:hypothetical protein